MQEHSDSWSGVGSCNNLRGKHGHLDAAMENRCFHDAFPLERDKTRVHNLRTCIIAHALTDTHIADHCATSQVLAICSCISCPVNFLSCCLGLFRKMMQIGKQALDFSIDQNCSSKLMIVVSSNVSSFSWS